MDAAPGDPGDSQRPGLTGGDGTFRKAAPANPQRDAGYGFRQDAFRFHVHAAVRAF